MTEIFIECSPGISGDMLLGALYDIGVPKEVFEKPLFDIGLDKLYSLSFVESKSSSIRGIKASVEVKTNKIKRDWRSIKKLITQAKLKPKLEKKIIKVFQTLAFAEGKVHGINPDDVHFHEIGSIDSLVDIIGVCSGLDYLQSSKVFCNLPSLGGGFANTEHGKITIPSPAVIELLCNSDLKVNSDPSLNHGELSTPTGIALLLSFVNSFYLPMKYSIDSYGVGIGTRKLTYPNLTRIYKINSMVETSYINSCPKIEEISIQEAWIDDQSAEEIGNFVQIFRDLGAYDICSQPINMKKDRVGYKITAIIPVEKEEFFRNIWFNQTNTIGLRENRERRWVLPRRKGECMTSFGKVQFKQIQKPNGEKVLKPENDEILRLQKEYQKHPQNIKKIIQETQGEFQPYEDWK